MTLEAIERARKNFHADLKAYYEDYRAELITKEIYIEKKRELEARLAVAEEMHKEYKEKVAARVLSNKDIDHIVRDCQRIADLLDEIGVLEHEHKRYIVERLDIRGRYAVENGYLVLYLTIHGIDFDRVYPDMSTSHKSSII